MTTVNTQWWANSSSEAKATRVNRAECVDKESRDMYQRTCGGRLSFKEKYDGSCWQIIVGAEVIATFETEESGIDEYHLLLNNKIAVGLILGHANMRENVGGFSGAGSYSGWYRP